MQWPEWWNWTLELTPHIEKRMVQRDFNEIDLRTILYNAGGLKEDKEPGRWIVYSKIGSVNWEIIVEPDYNEQLLVAVTAYSVKD